MDLHRSPQSIAAHHQYNHDLFDHIHPFRNPTDLTVFNSIQSYPMHSSFETIDSDPLFKRKSFMMFKRLTMPPWLNKNIVALGFTSLFSDLGHEMTTALLPAFII